MGPISNLLESDRILRLEILLVWFSSVFTQALYTRVTIFDMPACKYTGYLVSLWTDGLLLALCASVISAITSGEVGGPFAVAKAILVCVTTHGALP
jgi:hypothetical protein